jgi:hypothetical protein
MDGIRRALIWSVAVLVCFLELFGVLDPLKHAIGDEFIRKYAVTLLIVGMTAVHFYHKLVGRTNPEIKRQMTNLIVQNQRLCSEWKRLTQKYHDVKATDPNVAAMNMAKIDPTKIPARYKPFKEWYLGMDFYLGTLQFLYIDILQNRDRYENDFPIGRNFHKAPIPTDTLIGYFRIHNNLLELDLKKQTIWKTFGSNL